jgi:hypothetical protein
MSCGKYVSSFCHTVVNNHVFHPLLKLYVQNTVCHVSMKCCKFVKEQHDISY